MIDEWAVSVKPNADPMIIKKHIEKMVEVSSSAPAHSPLSVLIVAPFVHQHLDITAKCSWLFGQMVSNLFP